MECRTCLDEKLEQILVVPQRLLQVYNMWEENLCAEQINAMGLQTILMQLNQNEKDLDRAKYCGMFINKQN